MTITVCRRSILAMIAIALIVSLSVPVFAEKTEDASGDKVKAGFIALENYNYKDVNGQWRGYDIELLYKIAQYSDLEFELRPYESANTAVSDLRDGKVDLLIDFSKTEERKAEFLISSQSVASGTSAIYARQDDGRFSFGAYSKIDGAKLGTIEGSAAGELLSQYCTENDLSPSIKKYPSEEALHEALDDGEVDLACSGAAVAPAKYKSILMMTGDSSFILYRKGETALKEQVDKALIILDEQEPHFIASLEEEFAEVDEDAAIALTASESKYLEEHGTVTVAVPKDAEPYAKVDGKGNAVGIVPEYYRAIGERSGIEFEFIGCEDLVSAEELVRNGEADVLGFYYGDVVTAANLGLDITTPYAEFTGVMITRSGQSSIGVKAVAVTEHVSELMKVQLARRGYDCEVKVYDNISQCYEALGDGAVDAVACSITSGTWIVNQHSVSRVSIGSIPGVQINMSGCVNDQPELCSILNKAIAVSETDLQRLITQYAAPDQSNFLSIIENIPVKIIIAVTAVLLLLILALLAALFLLRKRSRERAKLAEEKAEYERREVQIAAEREYTDRQNRFFSNISHDMRTPLNAIIGFSDRAQKSDDMGQIKEDLDKIQTSGNILLNLINDTLTLSRMNSGKLVLTQEPLLLNELAEGVCVPIRVAAEQKGLTFTEELPEAPLCISCDELNIQKIYLNLLSNAVKYTESGGAVNFSLRSEEMEDGRVLVTAEVSDTGIGMAKDFLDHVYEPFVQEDNKTGKTTGTGLGLAIVKQLVDLMKGTIDVASEKGKGSTFTVAIPFEKAVLPGSAGPEGAAAGTDTDGAVDLTGKKILLCEDNELNAELATYILKDFGAEVEVQPDGKAGSERFEAAEPGEFFCILMDIRMPVMDGYEATRRIRALAEDPEVCEGKRQEAAGIPIIAMSADAFKEDVRMAKEAGMDSHISKPIDVDLLGRMLAEAEHRPPAEPDGTGHGDAE